MALPLHSILLPRRFIHVDDNRENLLAGCGPYIDRFELSPFPVLRTRLGIFLRSGEDVEGLVRVKGTLHFIAFSRRRVALLSEDNLMEGGIVSNLLISDPLDDILQVICAQIIENDLTLILVTSSAFHVRKIVVDPSGLRCFFLDAFDDLTTGYPLVSASFNGLATAFATLRQDGSVIFTLMFVHSKCGATFDFSTETTMRTLPIPSCPDDKATFMANLGDNKVFVVSSQLRRYIYTLTDKDGDLSCQTEDLPGPTEQRNGVLPLLDALSEDRRHVAIANSDRTIDYPLLDSEGKGTTNGTKTFFAPSTITSIAIVGKGKNTTIYYGTVTGEIACIPVSFYYEANSSIIAGSGWEEAVTPSGQGLETRDESRVKGVLGYGLVDPVTWLASDGSVYTFSPSRNGGRSERIGVEGVYRSIVSLNTHSSGIMAAFSSKHLLVYTATTVKQYTLNDVNLVAVAVHMHYICLQSEDGILSFHLAEGAAKLGRTPRLTQMAMKGRGLHVFVVGFDNEILGLLCGANSQTRVDRPQIDSLFTAGMAIDLVKITDEDGDSGFLRMGRFGSVDYVCALASSGQLFQIYNERYGSEMRLAETVAMERVLSLTLLPDGDLLVCGIREGVFVGVSLSSLRLLFSLSHRRDLFTASISQCSVLLKDDKFRITALNGQTLVEAVEPFYGDKTLIVERALHSEKIVAQTSVYIGFGCSEFGCSEIKASNESGHAIITASVDGHVVISSLWSNGRLVPLHRFRAPGVTCLAAFSYASQRCPSCVESETACIHRKAATETFRWVVLVAGTSDGCLYKLSFNACCFSHRVLDRPFPEYLRLPSSAGISSLHFASGPSLHGLVRATLFVGCPTSSRILEMSAMQKAESFDEVVVTLSLEEQSNRVVGQGLAAVGFGGLVASDSAPWLDSEIFFAHPLVHPSARVFVGSNITVIHSRFVYTSGSFRPREGSLIGTKDGSIFLWGIVEEAPTPEKRRKTVSLARSGDLTRLPTEDGTVEEQNAKLGVVTHWTPSKKIGNVVALSSTISPSSAATTIAAVFSGGKAAIFLLALDKIVFVQWLESEIKDPVGISVTLQGTDNLNSRSSSPYPDSTVVSGGNSIELVRICEAKLKKAIEKVWESS